MNSLAIKVKDAELLAKKYNKTKIVIIAVDEKETINSITYGESMEDKQNAVLLANLIIDSFKDHGLIDANVPPIIYEDKFNLLNDKEKSK